MAVQVSPEPPTKARQSKTVSDGGAGEAQVRSGSTVPFIFTVKLPITCRNHVGPLEEASVSRFEIPLVQKLIPLFRSVDAVMGPDLEKVLAELAATVEGNTNAK